MKKTLNWMVKMDIFKFALMEKVEIIASGETGLVVGRADYKDAAPMYYVQYKAADGRAVEAWWRESALFSIDETDLISAS